MNGKLLGVVVLALLLFATGIVSAGLVGHWAFDEGSGTTARDSSPNGNDGTLVGGPVWVDGVIDGALQFDGVDDYVEVPHNPVLAIAGEVTVSVWINAERHTGPGGVQWQGIMAKGNAPRLYSLYTQDGGTLHFSTGPGGAFIGSASTDQVPLNEWVHIAVVVDGRHTYYLNGEPAGEGGAGATLPGGGTAPLVIGDASDADREFLGMIDEPRIYDRVLTPEEVRGIFEGNPPVFLKAEQPDPPDGAEGVLVPLFQWRPGEMAMFHNVHLGTTPELTEADLVQAMAPAALYWHGPGLEPGLTYYWRVDEVQADATTVTTGDVWSLTTAPIKAYAPSPADEARHVSLDADLLWSPMIGALSHDVYLGTNRGDVAAGTNETFLGNVFETTFDPGPLEGDTVYYWRVDEVDSAGVKTAGDVWSFQTVPDILVTDPNLVGWWKLDELTGTFVLDSSGYSNHGQTVGDPEWVIGQDGGAVRLDGAEDYVEVPHDETLTVDAEATVMAWINPASLTGPGGSDYQGIVAKGNTVRSYSLYFQSAGTFHFSTTSAGAYVGSSSSGTAALDEWTHVAAMVVDGDHEYFINGEPAGQGGGGITLPGAADTDTVRIGTTQEGARFFNGMIDDVRIYRAALTQEAIQEAMRGDALVAWDSVPAPGAAVDIRDASTLSWRPGETAAQHDVYFGTDAAALLEADVDSPEYAGRQAGTSYALAGLVEFGGGPYFWRIDEVEDDGATIHAGRVWSFTVADYLIVDDFESYANDSPNRIFQTWVDGLGYSADEFFTEGNPGNGTGALVGHDIWTPESPHYEGSIAEAEIVQSGEQSMPLYYSNVDTPWYSEATRIFAPAQNWDVHGLTVLSLWYRGNPVAFAETGPGSVTMSGGGTDIWDMSDEFRFAYMRLNGDGVITAQVLRVDDTDAWAKAGVMIRESLDADSKHAMVVATPSSGVSFQSRSFTANASQSATVADVAAPMAWVRITRTGDTFTGQYSQDGVTWLDFLDADGNPVERNITMTANVFIGLAVTSHNPGVAAGAEFASITTSGGVSGQYQVESVGATQIGNDPDSLYVAVRDSGGRTHVAVNEDADAVLTTEWTPWTIPLTDLTAAGVDITSVAEMSVGVGSRSTPEPAGEGLVYIDSIHVVLPGPEPATGAAVE
jgi:regulation of enolase protein 1 (concanavalin A-like superfamily)